MMKVSQASEETAKPLNLKQAASHSRLKGRCEDKEKKKKQRIMTPWDRVSKYMYGYTETQRHTHTLLFKQLRELMKFFVVFLEATRRSSMQVSDEIKGKAKKRCYSLNELGWEDEDEKWSKWDGAKLQGR